MGVSAEAGAGAIRWSLGRVTTEAEVEHVLDRLREETLALRT
jgi:cysteine sulfinate desulfinase/cysteine desulfurase-like protein